jgi:hypothetical protein
MSWGEGGANCSLCPGCPMGKDRPWYQVIIKTLVARGDKVNVIGTDCLKVSEQGIFIQSVASLDTQGL